MHKYNGQANVTVPVHVEGLEVEKFEDLADAIRKVVNKHINMQYIQSGASVGEVIDVEMTDWDCRDGD